MTTEEKIAKYQAFKTRLGHFEEYGDSLLKVDRLMIGNLLIFNKNTHNEKDKLISKEECEFMTNKIEEIYKIILEMKGFYQKEVDKFKIIYEED